MGNRLNDLAKQLLGKASVEECSVDEIRSLTKRYPYFAPARFLAAGKLKQTASTEAASASAQAVLYYPDPLAFDYFMSSGKELSLDHASEIESTNDMEVAVAEEQESYLLTGGPIEQTDFSDAETDDDDLTIPQETVVETIEPDTPLSLSPEHLLQPDVDEAKKPAEPNMHPSDQIQAFTPDAQPFNEVPQTKDELIFEPFHTVDYFASQGIKITQDELPKDKLGKQLKSFTEWLKTMKRLPAMQLNEAVEIAAEKKVETLATYSVTESNVVTEAMAEVWAKQGAHQKAIETYNKLSLLNPSKKAFFAAKIENLKHS